MAHLDATTTVFEIGTGTGQLTDWLLQTDAQVISLEWDQKLYEQNVAKYAQQSKLQLLQGDIRQFDWSQLPTPYKICANIPYYLGANLLRCLTELEAKPTLAVLLFAQEVALKLGATGNRSLLATLVQSHYAVSLGKVIKAYAFEPPPKVDSQIVILEHRPVTEIEQNWAAFVQLLKIAFTQPRKQLNVNLQAGLQLATAEVSLILHKLNLPIAIRAEAVDNQTWVQLLHLLRPKLGSLSSRLDD